MSANRIPTDMIADRISGAKLSDTLASTAASLADIVQVSAKSFGAKGDGTTDNITAFQNLSNFVNTMLVTPVEVYFPAGTYNFSGGLAFTVQCRIKGQMGTVFNYTGTGNAITLGVAGMTKAANNYQNQQMYEVEGITFIGGSSMAYGIYVNQLVTKPRIRKCNFIGFGNANSWSVYLQAGNWDTVIQDCTFDLDASSNAGGNGVYNNSYYADGTPDYGNSRIRMNNVLMRGGGGLSQVGVFLNSANCSMSLCKIEGFAPAVMFGGWANFCSVDQCYFEGEGASVFLIGSPSARPDASQNPSNIFITNNYINVHNTDFSTTTVVVAPTQTTTLIKNLVLANNNVTSLTSTSPAVTLNNLNGQTNNLAYNNTGIGVLHTTGTNISDWYNGTGQGALNLFNMVDAPYTHTIKTGITAEQNTVFQLMNYANTQIANFTFNTSGYMSFTNRGVASYTVTPTGDFIASVTSRAPKFILNAQQSAGSVVSGTLFEDSADGKLKYKNIGGTLETMGRFVAVPASATATGTPGDWSADASYYYFCYATNSWHRIASSTW